MKKKTKQLVVIFLFINLLIIGYIRETLFVVINTVLNKIPFPYNASYVAPPSFLFKYSTAQLNTAKWGMTFFFAILFMVMTSIIIKIYFNNKRYVQHTQLIYITFFLLALLIFILGYSFNVLEIVYPLSRFLIGLVHSPLLALVIFLLSLYKESFKNYI